MRSLRVSGMTSLSSPPRPPLLNGHTAAIGGSILPCRSTLLTSNLKPPLVRAVHLPTKRSRRRNGWRIRGCAGRSRTRLNALQRWRRSSRRHGGDSELLRREREVALCHYTFEKRQIPATSLDNILVLKFRCRPNPASRPKTAVLWSSPSAATLSAGTSCTRQSDGRKLDSGQGFAVDPLGRVPSDLRFTSDIDRLSMGQPEHHLRTHPQRLKLRLAARFVPGHRDLDCFPERACPRSGIAALRGFS